MRDQYGRELHDLRISLTDRCNFRCVYCMPSHGVEFRPPKELLQDDELLLLVRIAAELGVRKIRLTGGEPTVRANLVGLVRGIASTPGIQDVAMTTNGMLLARMAADLAAAGLRRVNISIDTLDPEKFRRITRTGTLGTVLDGLHAAEEAGLRPIKINAVVVRGFNEDDVADLAALTFEHDWEVRFIEMMPFGEAAFFQTSAMVPEAEIRARVEAAHGPLEPVDLSGVDPARTYRLPGARGAVGLISSLSEPFCARCGRIRLTSDGRLRLCLLRDDEADLLTPLRRGATYDEMREIFGAATFRRPFGHALAEGLIPLSREMIQIGG